MNSTESQSWPRLNQDKIDLIDFAFQMTLPSPRSFADLGGVWNVAGGYSTYTMSKYQIDRGLLVDTHLKEAEAPAANYAKLELIQGNFGDPVTAAALGRVDIVFMFDVLLHQVDPDWDQVLTMYSPVTDRFAIFNQQYTWEATIRLLDLGKEGYFDNVPSHCRRAEHYRLLFEKMYEIHPEHNKVWRDCHAFWQWGITDGDLRAKMDELGYNLIYYRNCGLFLGMRNCENHAFLFQRR